MVSWRDDSSSDGAPIGVLPLACSVVGRRCRAGLSDGGSGGGNGGVKTTDDICGDEASGCWSWYIGWRPGTCSMLQGMSLLGG